MDEMDLHVLALSVDLMFGSSVEVDFEERAGDPTEEHTSVASWKHMKFVVVLDFDQDRRRRIPERQPPSEALDIVRGLTKVDRGLL